MYKTQCVLALVVLYVGLAHSWDLAVSMGDQLQFYTNATKTNTVHFNSQILSALAYDEIHNMLLYVDKQSNNDAICVFNLSSMEHNNKCITEGNGRNIQSLAFDPATEMLFFSDANEKSINWISLKPGAYNNIYGNLLVKMDDGIPTSVAIDSCRGFVYWINTNLTRPTIERARFNGSERAVVINLNSVTVNATYTLEPHSLTIDQQTQKMYWVEPVEPSKYKTYSSDLNGENIITDSYFHFNSDDIVFPNPSNVLTVASTSLISWAWIANSTVWVEPKTRGLVKELLKVETEIPIGLVANYKIADQVLGLTNCDALTSLGFIGERCDVSVCTNYCSHGLCSINGEGLPICSCVAGYSGERCDYNSCHNYCRNNGVCNNYLNEESEPVCICKAGYVGERCDISSCMNYCDQGYCRIDEDEYPTCSCYPGYTGKRCEVDMCQSYCLNDGNCSLDDEYKPVCQCDGNHEGSRCESAKAVSPTVHKMTQIGNAFRDSPTTKTLSLVDLLRKPSAKVTVTVEV